MDGIDVRIAGGREGTSTNCAPPSASRFRRFTMAWRMAQAVIAAATSAISIAAVDDASADAAPNGVGAIVVSSSSVRSGAPLIPPPPWLAMCGGAVGLDEEE
jgi:hypothetical protein